MSSRLELSPGLSATVVEHALDTVQGALPVWTYVSQGLATYGQAEVVMTLLRREDEAPSAPLLLFEQLHRLARESRRVGVGEYSELGPRGFLGEPALGGIGYAPVLSMEGVDTPPEALAAIALWRDELALCKVAGLGRLLPRLSQLADHYPFPPWIDVNRPSVVVEGDLDASLLPQVPRLVVQGTEVHQDADTIVVRLPRASREQLAPVTTLPHDAPLALLALPPAAATASLVWRPGQPSPQACAAPDGDLRLVGGAFCLLVPQQEADGGELSEDGFAMRLTDETWARARRALETGEDLEVRSRDASALHLRLRWS